MLNRKLPVPAVEVPQVNLSETIKVNFNDKSERAQKIDDWTFINNM